MSCQRAYWIRISLSESSALVASSSSRIGAWRRMARAIATRWRWPPDGLIPRAPTVVSRPVGQGLGELGDVCRLRGTVDFGVAGTGVANAMLSPSVRWNMAGPVACRRSTCAGLPER
jgi:hypothetical protein